MIHLNSKTSALVYGANVKLVHFSNAIDELKSLPNDIYNLLASLTSEENLRLLDRDIATEDIVLAFANSMKKEIDSVALSIENEIRNVQEIQSQLKLIYEKIDDFVQQAYLYDEETSYIV